MNGGNRPAVCIIPTGRADCKPEKGVQPVKIYIAGNITGDRKYRAKFREAAKTLEALGHVVLNPATLPDYQESASAMVEWAWCPRTGKDCALYMDVKGGGTR